MTRRTLADVHREEGAFGANKRTLLKQLRLRWGPLPAEIEQVIETTQDANQLEEWLGRFATAKDLDTIGIGPSS